MSHFIGETVSLATLGMVNPNKHPGPAPLQGPPTIDTAANMTAQQADILRRRRGVLSNIYAGANQAGIPAAPAPGAATGQPGTMGQPGAAPTPTKAQLGI
jgi:hypothetical protein